MIVGVAQQMLQIYALIFGALILGAVCGYIVAWTIHGKVDHTSLADMSPLSIRVAALVQDAYVAVMEGVGCVADEVQPAELAYYISGLIRGRTTHRFWFQPHELPGVLELLKGRNMSAYDLGIIAKAFETIEAAQSPRKS